MFNRNSKDVQIIQLPNIPPTVDLAELDKNFHLLSAKDVAQLNKRKLTDGRYSKHALQTRQAIAVLNGQVHAIYSEAIGRGAFGKVKPSQNEQTGDWEAYKISPHSVVKEAGFLQKMGLLAASGANTNQIKYEAKNHGGVKNALFMRYLSGFSLAGLQSRDLSMHQWIQIMLGLVKVAKELANKRIQHGDLNDTNFLYDFIDNKVHLLDFGTANDLNKNFYYDVRIILDDIKSWISDSPHKEWMANNVNPVIDNYLKECENLESAEDVEKFCDAIIADLLTLDKSLPEGARTYAIGILDIADLKAQHGDFDMTKLTSYSEIWLVDRKKKGDVMEYLQYRQALQKAGIWVGDKVFLHAAFSNLTSSINEMCMKRHPECAFSFYNAASAGLLELPDVKASEKPVKKPR